MASTPVIGDLVLLAPPTSGSAVLAAGLYVVIGQSGTTVTVVDKNSPIGGNTPGIVVPLSRVLFRYANS